MNLDGEISFAPMSFKLGSAYVSEDSKKNETKLTIFFKISI